MSTALQAAPILKRLSDVEPEAVTWLWSNRIPRGRLTLLAGDPGVSKSHLMLDLVARITKGAPWPDGGQAPLGSVVILSAEDGLADTIRPRLDAAGADRSRVVALEGVREATRGDTPFNLARHPEALHEAIKQLDAVTVVIDPLSAYLQGTDTRSDAEVRGVIAPAARLAEETGVAVVAVRHLNKRTDLQAMYRCQDSIAFVAAARAVHLVVADEADPDRRLFVPLKMNLARMPPGLAYRVETVPHTKGFEIGRVVWERDPVHVDVESVLAGPETEDEKSAKQEAEKFLSGLLQEGPVPQKTVEEEARKAGVSLMTLKRAKQSLRVESVKRSHWWEWSHPKGKGLNQGAH